MPNWCENTLTIEGSIHSLKAFIELAGNEFDFEKVKPDGEWGTKWSANECEGWDDCDLEGKDEDKGYVNTTFQTAWGPPIEVMEHLEKLFPDFKITLTYKERGNCFMGAYTTEKRNQRIKYN